MTAPSIRKLSPHVVGKIAAGEVVERPLSVVKELIENSLDAGARTISVEVGRGGLELIRVTDDGSGVDPSQLALAFERHATSKLLEETDLEQVSTLGFRGEALPSIAAVAEVEMISCAAGAISGAFVRLADGVVVEEGSRGAPAGTAVAVRRLFQRQPARLKFLRSPAAEASQIASVVSHYALAFPEVRFSLSIDGRVTLLTPGSGKMREAAAGVYGHRLAGELLEIASNSSLAEVRVNGLAAPPSISRASRSYISVFINRRWVRNRSLTFAVEEAYHGMLPVGRHPLAAVDIHLPAADVDVNVHPAKTEVRLLHEREVFGAIQKALRSVLSSHSPVPHLSPSTWAGTWTAPTLSQASPVGRPALTLPSQGEQKEMPLPQPSQGESAPRRLPVLRALGQVGLVYIVAEGPEGLYLVDQHAAHERILFERFLAIAEGSQVDTQALLEPVPVELSPRQQTLISEMGGELAAQGFLLEPFGERTYLVRTLPAAFGNRDVAASLLQFLDVLDHDEGTGALDSRRERVAMSLACHSAIRAGQSLNAEEMREMLRQLEETESSRTCPHGRPTMVHLSADALAREFRRR